MWIVQLALRRPYTFIVAALLLVLATPWVLSRMAVDVFPEVDIPVVGILVSYNGLSAKEMSERITLPIERGFGVGVSDIEHVESQTVAGLGVIKVFFHPRVNMATAMAQLVAATQASLRSLPPGTTPPTILRYSATNLPVLQLGVTSATVSEQELNDQTYNTLRARLTTVQGAAVTFPFGSRSRQVSVELDGPALLARGLTAVDVVNAISAQNLMLPTGIAKIGATEYGVALNGSPTTLAQLNDIPIRQVDGTPITLRDVAHVRDGFQPATNIVRRDGERGLLLSVMKNGGASTLDIIDNIKGLLPKILAQLPEGVEVTPLLDQSLFVKAAMQGVLHEGLIAAGLTAALILLFLGNWRSTLIIAVSIPLSILSSILLLYLSGHTINLMTLGGLALAVGILVDDATVEIENIERQLHLGKPVRQAILDGAQEIAVPALVSTLAICIVFVPMFFLPGVSYHLFVPLALAVVYAMLSSYVISRTLVPTLVMYLMRRHTLAQAAQPPRHFVALWRAQQGFERRFERLRSRYAALLGRLLARRGQAAAAFSLLCVLSLGLYGALGREFFPTSDTGQLRLHARAPSGTRLEEMPQLTDRIEAALRELLPEGEIETLVDNIGGPYSPINTLYGNNGTVDAADIELLVSLKAGHRPTSEHQQRLRAELPRRFPGVEFFFQPADMISQTLNFGLSSPIDIQLRGPRVEENLALAGEIARAVRAIPGAVDTHVYQRFDKPTLSLEMDRNRLQASGLQAKDVAQNVLVSLSSSFQTAPTYWLNPANGNVLNVAVQTRQHEMDSLDAVLRIPVNAPGGGAQLLGSVVQVRPTTQQAVLSRYNFLQVLDVRASVAGRDLGAVAGDVDRLLQSVAAKLPRGTEIEVRGQGATMQSTYRALALGLVVAIVLVYLLIVVNFQSWRDAAIILAALPAALAGIAWLLFLSGTPLSVPALTGAVMTVGVATANSILLVSFARERHAAGVSPLQAALDAGITRLRPVLMTAAAMILGMLPMAIGVGAGAEQNAPLGRAVIGGLLLATVSTLLFVPLVYALVHQRRDTRRAPRPAIALVPEPAIAPELPRG
jgi:CzcA family heavy metal efflux pump